MPDRGSRWLAAVVAAMLIAQPLAAVEPMPDETPDGRAQISRQLIEIGRTPQHAREAASRLTAADLQVLLANPEMMQAAGGAQTHAAIGVLPLFAMCDRWDIGGLSTPAHVDTGKPQVFIYDAFPGGVGIAEKGFELLTELWRATLRAIKECPCEAGCPSCVQSPKCGNNNEPLDKEAAVVILEGLLGK